jgi:hypothetical protein
MKFEVTHPKIWKKLAEKNMPMKHKIQLYEKLGGAYRLGENKGEQVFNKMTELLRNRINEGDENSPEETLSGLKRMAMGDLERIADYANMIETRMKEGQELSSWMYSQITLAVDQLNSVHDAMDGKDGEREPMKEVITNPNTSNPNVLATAIIDWYDFASDYIDNGGQRRKAEKSNEDVVEWFASHPSDIKQKAFKLMVSKQPSIKSKIEKIFGSSLKESVKETNTSDIIKDLDKVRTDLIKKVDALIVKKKNFILM